MLSDVYLELIREILALPLHRCQLRRRYHPFKYIMSYVDSESDPDPVGSEQFGLPDPDRKNNHQNHRKLT